MILLTMVSAYRLNLNTSENGVMIISNLLLSNLNGEKSSTVSELTGKPLAPLSY